MPRWPESISRCRLRLRGGRRSRVGIRRTSQARVAAAATARLEHTTTARATVKRRVRARAIITNELLLYFRRGVVSEVGVFRARPYLAQQRLEPCLTRIEKAPLILQGAIRLTYGCERDRRI